MIHTNIQKFCSKKNFRTIFLEQTFLEQTFLEQIFFRTNFF